MSTPAERFRVSFSEAQRERLGEWSRLAAVAGLSAKLAATLKELMYRLAYEADDDAWARRYDYLPGLEVSLRRGQVPLLSVYFALHQKSKSVFVKDLTLETTFRDAIRPAID